MNPGNAANAWSHITIQTRFLIKPQEIFLWMSDKMKMKYLIETNLLSLGTGHYLWPRGDRVQMTFYKKTHHAMENFRGPLDIPGQFFNAPSWCKIFMYCIHKGIGGLQKMPHQRRKFLQKSISMPPLGFSRFFRCPLSNPQNIFDAPSLLNPIPSGYK